ncbi:MAG: glutaredoxin domain-containing protein [Nakamurella sp.]
MTAPINPAVDFLWRPGCGFCAALHRQLTAAGVPMNEFNIWEDEGAADRVRAAANGNETVPTVYVGEHAMVNPSLDEVLAAIEKAGNTS